MWWCLLLVQHLCMELIPYYRYLISTLDTYCWLRTRAFPGVSGLKWRQSQTGCNSIVMINITIIDGFWYICVKRTWVSVDINKQRNVLLMKAFVFNKINLVLLERTQVTVGPESFTYTANVTMMTMDCASETDDSTPLTVEWRHRGVTLRSGYDPRLNITEDHTIIIDVEGMELQEISNRFSGEYTCVAYNGYTSGTGVSLIIVPGALPTGKLKKGDKLCSSGVESVWLRTKKVSLEPNLQQTECPLTNRQLSRIKRCSEK